jgi:hypothetical protein
MNFDNSLFENTPIEFKEINHTDFDSDLYNVEPKEIVKPIKGYLSDNLIPILTKDLHNKNTTVINAGVGQGKTTAILEIIEKFADHKNYVVVIAVPFKSLIKQYEKECIEKGISKRRIFNQLEIDKYFEKKEVLTEKTLWGKHYDDEEVINAHKDKFKIRNFDIHILTVNALLGNSVESLFQSKKKTKYFNRLLGYCEKADKKLIFIFDEIHASIHNFKEEFICKLWNYHGLVHKNYIVSATYNEASKEVIKYLSEFTGNNIKIIESIRLPLIEKQSELYLNFYTDKYIEKDEKLYNLILSLLDGKKKFDILVYSKSLAQKLTKSGNKIGQLFKERNVTINKCYNDLYRNDDDEVGYNSDAECTNIGTKFSTGISIKHEEHTFIVMFPRDLHNEYIKNKGIFSMGSNSIIQALARQREPGKIYVYLPPPLDIDKDTLPTSYSESQKKELLKIFNKCKAYSSKLVKYSNVNQQNLVLSKTYTKLYYEVTPALDKIKSSERDSKMNRLLFPTQEIFNLDKGENHLVKDFFGGNLSAYILWASTTNQFLNCKLKSIVVVLKVYLYSENLYEQLEAKVKKMLYDLEVIEVGYFYRWRNPYEKLELFKKFIFSNIVILDKEKVGVVQKEKILLEIIKFLYFNSKTVSKTEVYHYYLKSCIISSKVSVSDIESYKLQKSKIDLIGVYSKWKDLKDIIKLNVENYKKHTYIHNKANKAFVKAYKEIGFKKDIEFLLDNDLLLSTNIFTLKNNYNKEKSLSKKIAIIYNLTIKTFFANKKSVIGIKAVDTSVYLFRPKEIDNISNLLFSDRITYTI